jgi:CHAT domain-containing protein
MSLPQLLRATVALLSVALLASCATTHSSLDDPREWSFSPMVEANKFYTSGLSVEDYVKGKPTEGRNGVQIYYLCNGLTEAGDAIRTAECGRIFDKVAARASNDKLVASVFATYREFIDIAANQFLLEQGRFKEVENNLLPYMQREAALFTFDRSKSDNAKFRMTALPILARAQRNLNGLSEEVRVALEESNPAFSFLGALINPRGMAAYDAERLYMLGDYAACYDKVSRSSIGVRGLGDVVSFQGEAASMDRMLGVIYTRLQALCAYEAGLMEDAKLSYQDLLNHPDVQFLRGTQRLAHFHLAQIAMRQNQRDEAIKHLRSSVDALESERAAIDSEAGRLGYVMNKSDIYAQLVDLLVEQSRDAEAFEFAERGKARALIDMLGSKRSTDSAGKSGALSQALQAIDESDNNQSGMPAILSRGTRSAPNVRQDISRANPELGSLVTVSALPTADVQKRLQSGETLVEFFGEGDRLFAFVVTQNRVKAVRLDAKAVAEHARAFRTSMTDSSSRDYQARGKRLYEATLAPVMSYMDSGPLTVVPHAELHYVPFAALHDGSKYLIQKVDLRLLPSASVLPFLGNAGSKGNGLLILGNPDLGNRSLDLPGAEEEARMLQRINRGARTLLRAQASETALRKMGPQFREIHFAMHGKFDSVNAMSSGLYMARDAENDGVLSVGELYDLQLNVDLVVLSACETALGDASKGDDVVGLNRGFLFAGARSIVSSLWEVDDNATRDLMVAFYKQRGKHGKAGGLRQAQLATLAKYPHPYYWAAFQMSGLF